MPVGVATVDFGAGSWEAKAVVTGRADITSASKVEPFVMATPSADHSADEHRIERLSAIGGEIVDGVGFSIWVKPLGNHPLRGEWTIHWVYTV